MYRAIIIFLISIILFGQNTDVTPPSVLNIEDFGAISNDEELDTEAINKAIDSCSTLENGIIVFSGGTYLTGSIHLKSNVTLQIEKEAKIQAAPKGMAAFDEPEENSWDKYQDFGLSHFHNALIWGESIENVSIRGEGIISGTASLYSSPEMGEADKALSFKLCKNLDIKNVTIVDGGYLAILATGCEGVNIYDVKVETNGDGISLVGSSDVDILNCELETIGDGISLKSDYSLGRKLNSGNIKIGGCIITAGSTALAIGPETVGNFRNIQISNITIKKADKVGISFTSNHGAMIDGVNVQNITMDNVAIPFFINLSKLKGGTPDSPSIGEIKNIRVSNAVVKNVYGYTSRFDFTSTFTGRSNKMLENIVLENMRITYKGGSLSYLGLKDDPARIEIPKIEDYRAEKYGLRPSYGLYCRYIKDLKIRNVSVDFEKEDPRPAVILRDIGGVVMNRFYAERSTIRDYDIITDKVGDFMITGSPGVVQIEKKDFVPLDSFDVDASPNPTAEDVAAGLGIEKPPILLSDLPPLVIEKVEKELGISPAMLHVLVDKNISKVERADGAVYDIRAEDKKVDKYELEVREDGSLVSKKKI